MNNMYREHLESEEEGDEDKRLSEGRQLRVSFKRLIVTLGRKFALARCADMDKKNTTLMGVTKAVLENIIFVHQDDANWPL